MKRADQRRELKELEKKTKHLNAKSRGKNRATRRRTIKYLGRKNNNGTFCGVDDISLLDEAELKALLTERLQKLAWKKHRRIITKGIDIQAIAKALENKGE